jgi:hypothetical protein
LIAKGRLPSVKRVGPTLVGTKSGVKRDLTAS